MTQKHTPEPYDYVYENGAWEGYYEPESGSFEIVFRTDSEANAARIVDCVNAMQGIEDPETWVKDQKQYRDQMANSSLSAEIIKRQQLERLHEFQINQLVNQLNELKNEKS